MQKFEDVTPEEVGGGKSKRFSPSSNKNSDRHQTGGAGVGGDGISVDGMEEIAGASGGGATASSATSVSSEALWLNFDAEDVEEQFLLSADLEKTKKERKPRQDPP